MDKRVANADAAIAQYSRWRNNPVGRIRPLRHSGKLDCRLQRKGSKNLTLVSNNAGIDDFGIGLLLQTSK